MAGERQASTAEERMAVLQGSFDVVTGLWPIVHLRSFEVVTGPKLEGWLVKTVGALITVIGGTLLTAGLRRRITPEVRLLGMGTAAAFTLVDIIYTSRRRISPVYLLDAVAEVALVAGWSMAYARSRGRSERVTVPARTAWTPVHAPPPVPDAAYM
jgi:hypothetical protein